MSATAAASATAAGAAPAAVSVPHLCRLLVRWRLRHAWNTLRARPVGPAGLQVLLGLGMAVFYVMLVAQALLVLGAREVAASAGAEAQAVALALVVGAIAAANLAARAAGGEAVVAGSAENELYLARPLSLRTLVLARCLAGPATDPFGALFLLPALLAGAVIWELPPGAWVVAVATSVVAEVAIAAGAQAVQIAVVRWVPRRHRQSAWTALRLASVLTIAAVWVSATSVLRAAEWLAPRLPALGRILRFTPAGALVAPLEGYRAGGAAAAAAAFVPLGALAAGALVLAAVIARRAGMRGWEEAGAPFAEASAAPRSAPPLGLVRREWRLLLRDRPRLLSLVALPGTFIGVQLVGSAGWAWTTASVDRVAMVTFSFVLYIATLGPLAHMQGERRAFWIAYTVPVPLGTLMAAKVKAWAPILAGTAAAVFLALATQLPDASAGDLARAGILVVAGAVAMTAMAVAFAAATADLSDPQRGAIGPGAVYLFLFMGGLYNIILVERGWGVAPLLALYGGVTAATWRAGMVRAACCFDAEALARRPVRLADAAILLLATALFPRAAGSGLAAAGAGSDAPATARATALVVVAIAAAVYLARRERRGAIPSPAVALAAGIAAGVGGAVLLRLAGVEAPAAGTVTGGVVLAVIVAGALAEELVLRGVVQRAVEEELHACFSRFANPLEPRQLPGRQARIRHASRWLAAAVALAATLVVVPGPPAAVAVIALAPTVARATGGTMWAAVLARAIVVFVIVSGSGLSGG